MTDAAKSPIVGGRFMLQGPGGTGKTTSLRTMVDAGLQVNVISLDPAGLSVLGDIPCPKLHWHVVRFAGRSWTDMIADMKRQAPMDYAQMAASKDANKSSQQTRFIDLLGSLADFKCDRCGAALGMVDKWGTGSAIALDHLTEMSAASKEWTVGNKLVLHEGEWQAAMNVIENLIRQLVAVTRCWVVVIAHIDKEIDPIQGGFKVMAATLGKKLAPKLPPFFGDVVSVEREGKVFKWSTATPGTDLKTRILPIDANLTPSFVQAVELWKKKGGIVE